MKKIITTLTFIFLFPGALLAQINYLPVDTNAGEFKFDDETWDFGNVNCDETVTHYFHFTNVGKEPIVISECHSNDPALAYWPKEPILPGKSDMIRVIYTPFHHTGSFNKSVTITSNANPNIKVIYVKGNSVTTPNDSIGELRFEGENWDFGNIPEGEPIEHDFHFTNIGKRPVIISNYYASPGTTATLPKEPVLPGKTGVIKVSCHAFHTGSFRETVTIVSDAKTGSTIINITGNVEQK